MGLHRNVTDGDNHVIQAFVYANTGARTSATGLVPADIGRVAQQLDDSSFWILTADDPVTWAEIGAPAGTLSGHESLNSLVHEVNETSYVAVTRVDSQVTNVTIWTDYGMTVKIRETIITRSGGAVSECVERQYDEFGVLIVGQQLTSSFTRTAGVITSVNAVKV